jgi:phosphotriesterase-related protein
VKKVLNKYFLYLLVLVESCSPEKTNSIQSVGGTVTAAPGEVWLSHEHILVDFIGADSIDKTKWHHDSVINAMSGYLEELKQHNVKFFVDATPAYLGRDVLLLEKLAKKTGLAILTNTGFYGAVNDKYIPSFAFAKTAKELAEIWINEYENGIEGTPVKPGFIKISVDARDTLDAIGKSCCSHAFKNRTDHSFTHGTSKGLMAPIEDLKGNEGFTVCVCVGACTKRG